MGGMLSTSSQGEGIELPINNVDIISEVNEEILNEMLLKYPGAFGEMKEIDGKQIRCFGGTCGCGRHPGPPGPDCSQNMVLSLTFAEPESPEQKWPKKILIFKGEIVGFIY